MHSLVSNQSLNNTGKVRSGLLLLTVCCLMAISSNASAQYWDPQPPQPQRYHTDIEKTDAGGGTWGAILRLSVRIEGSTAKFNITSKKGPFYNTNSVNIRSGSHTGTILASGKITPGSEAASLHLDLNNVSSFPQRFYAAITNNYGKAWAGYVQISQNDTVTPPRLDPSRRDPPRPGGDPQRPFISDNPAGAAVNTQVNIPVTAGKTQSGDSVRIQCTASNSDRTRNTPYSSDWIHAGSTVNASFTFYSTGPQTIFCNTHGGYGATSSLTQRTITVAHQQQTNTPPPAPVITSPAQAAPYTPISISVAAGATNYRGYGDAVKISCTADGSNRTANTPYISPALKPGAASDAMFLFHSPGTKNISCIAYTRQGVSSPSTQKSIAIQPENHTPLQPKISSFPYGTETGKTTYITVTAGNDPDGDQVRVKCATKDSNITGNDSYLSEWVAPGSTVNVSLTFYSAGGQEISCVTSDRKGATSGEAVRKIKVSRPRINSRPHMDSNPDNCSCKHKAPPAFNLNQFQKPRSTCNVCGKKRTANSPYQGDITYNRPYIPGHTNHRDNHPEFVPVTPDLRGQVVYSSNGTPVQNARIKVWNPASGRTYAETTDFDGQYSLDLVNNHSYLIQATKGEFTSSIRELRIKADAPSLMNLTILDRQRRRRPMIRQRWSTPPAPAPANNSIWQFN